MNRRLGIAAVAVLVAAVGCKKEKSEGSGDGAPERDGKALWKLAPEGTRAGIVVAAGAGPELHRGFIAVVKSLQGTELGGKAVAEMLAEAKRDGVDPMSADGFKSIGVDTSKAAALFLVGEDDAYGIVPIGDRAAFRKKIEAVEKNGVDIAEGESACKLEGDYYRCAKSLEKLEAWKPAAKALDDGWPGELRGSIEFFVDGKLLAEQEPVQETMSQATALRGAVRIERGAALLRFSIGGSPEPMLSVGETPLADAARSSKPAALMTVYGRSLVDLARSEIGDAIDEVGPGGVTPGKLLDAITGELVAFAPAGGEPRGFVELGITDPAPFKAISTLCSMAPPLAPGITIKSTNDGCAASFGPPTTPMQFDIAVAITDKAIVAKLGAHEAGRSGDGPALPRYYTGERWLGSLWLRGSLLGSEALMQVPQIGQVLQQGPEIGMGLWAYAHLSELGLGLRTDDRGVHGFFRVATTWRNPQPIVDKLEPLIARFARGDLAATADVVKLAEANKSSPLATDISLGGSGGTASAAALGAIAAVAIPAFIKYQKRARSAGLEMFVRQFQAIELQMCACQDQACAAEAQKSFEQWRTQLGPVEQELGSHPEMTEAMVRYTQCMSRALGSP